MELTVEELSLLRDAFDTGQKSEHGKSDRKKGNSENRGHFRKLAAAWDEMPAGAKAEIMVAFSVRLSVDPGRLINPSIFDLGPCPTNSSSGATLRMSIVSDRVSLDSEGDRRKSLTIVTAGNAIRHRT